MEIIRLTSAVHGVIIHHARTMLPAEAVGMLGGDLLGRATLSIPLPNRAGQKAFLADPFAQFQAERQLAHLGLQVIAVYHSHPGGGAQLSELDLIFARRRACIQLVIALGRPHLLGEELRAYRVVENRVMGVQVYIEG